MKGNNNKPRRRFLLILSTLFIILHYYLPEEKGGNPAGLGCREDRKVSDPGTRGRPSYSKNGSSKARQMFPVWPWANQGPLESPGFLSGKIKTPLETGVRSSMTGNT